jgi:hypothetical protein
MVDAHEALEGRGVCPRTAICPAAGCKATGLFSGSISVVCFTTPHSPSLASAFSLALGPKPVRGQTPGVRVRYADGPRSRRRQIGT